MNSTTSTVSPVTPPAIHGPLSRGRRVAISLVPSNSQRELWDTATAKYAAALQSNADALEYLRKRGLSQASAVSFKLGVVAEPLTGHEQYQGRLAIPYLTRSGAVGMAFRCIAHDDCKAAGHKQKYLWPEGQTRRMFNTPALDMPSSFICVCEGEMDAITASQCGLPAVAIPGVQSWQAFWARPLKGYDVVYILRDDDDAGQGMADKVCRDVPQARPVAMTGGDVNSFVLEHGEGALRARIGV
jgi:DNA primase